MDSRPLHEGVDWNRYDSALSTAHAPVALFTRAWIEILQLRRFHQSDDVALFTRAWIEINYFLHLHNIDLSPSSRGRGLKSLERGESIIFHAVALFTRAWIEIDGTTPFDYVYTSRPLHEGVDWNHMEQILQRVTRVALFTRAWIEIPFRWRKIRRSPSPSSRGRGLK